MSGDVYNLRLGIYPEDVGNIYISTLAVTYDARQYDTSMRLSTAAYLQSARIETGRQMVRMTDYRTTPTFSQWLNIVKDDPDYPIAFPESGHEPYRWMDKGK